MTIRPHLLVPFLLAAAVTASAAGPIEFREIPRGRSGIDFDLDTSMAAVKMIATMGGGIAAGDYDGDGFLDLFFAGSADDPDDLEAGPCGTLYRSRGDGTFENATPRSGIRACGWQMGASFVDVDSDGRLDLVVTGLDATRLYRNVGGGRFADETASRRVATGRQFSIGLAAGDVDGDGRLDLYFVGYLETTPEKERAFPTLALRMPEEYPSQEAILFRQQEDGTFADLTAAVGCANAAGKGTGAVFFDYDRDGRPDLFVANDRAENRLYRNETEPGSPGAPRFRDVSDETGAGAREGRPRAGMGIAVGDPFGAGFPSLYVTNFAGETNLLYRNIEGQLFDDATEETNTGRASWEYVQWGTHFADFDDDGWEDLYAVSGHLVPRYVSWLARLLGQSPSSDMAVGDLSFAQPPVLWRNRGEGRFDEASATSGDFARLRIPGRGSAIGDFDADGRIDLVLGVIEGRPRFLRNTTRESGHVLEILPVAGADRRTVLGTTIRVTVGGRARVQQFLLTPSYASGGWIPLHFGLGAAASADRVEVIPPGATEPTLVLENVPADRLYRLVDGKLEEVRRIRR